MNQLGSLFCSLIGVLLAASAAAYLIKRRYSPNAPHAVIDNLTARINAWWVMIITVFVFAYFGNTALSLLFFMVSFAALREFLSLLYIRRGDHIALVACFYVILPLQYYFVLTGWFAMAMIFIPVYAFLFLPILAAFSGDAAHFLKRSTAIQWALMICVFCISHIPLLFTLEIDGFAGRETMLALFLILIVQASDVFQYIWGKLLGKRKIAPTLSPSKTVAGFVGGVACASLLAGMLHFLTPFGGFVQAFAVGLVSCLMGFWGGLVMSAVKRDLQVKDWGRSISGHGGILDRMDSLCFAAPIYFHLVRYFWT